MSAANGFKRMTPSEFEYDLEDPAVSIEGDVLDLEDHDEVRSAFDTLEPSDQELLRLTVLEPGLSYEEISQITGRPVGSLGPTRARALDASGRRWATTRRR